MTTINMFSTEEGGAQLYTYPISRPNSSIYGMEWARRRMEEIGHISLVRNKGDGKIISVTTGRAMSPLDDTNLFDHKRMLILPGLEHSFVFFGSMEEGVYNKDGDGKVPALCVNMVQEGFTLNHMEGLNLIKNKALQVTLSSFLTRVNARTGDVNLNVETSKSIASRGEGDIIVEKDDYGNAFAVSISFGDTMIKVELFKAPTASDQLMAITAWGFNRDTREFEVKESLTRQDVLRMYGVLMVATAKPLGEPESE